MKPQCAISERPGFTWVELLVVIAIVALAGGCCCAHFGQEKISSQRLACHSNLAQVGLAFRMWSDDHDKMNPMLVSTNQHGSLEYSDSSNVFRHFQCMSNELIDPKLLNCPADNRTSATDFRELTNDNVSYFVGLNADETMPQMFLTGDRNLLVNDSPVQSGVVSIKSTDDIGWTQEIHHGQANIGLADGSVQQYTSSALQQAMRHTGTNVNRLAVP